MFKIDVFEKMKLIKVIEVSSEDEIKKLFDKKKIDVGIVILNYWEVGNMLVFVYVDFD